MVYKKEKEGLGKENGYNRVINVYYVLSNLTYMLSYETLFTSYLGLVNQ